MVDDEFSRLQAAVARNPGSRTPLFRWLLDHHTETTALLRRFGKNWTGMAEGFNELGLKSRNNKPITPMLVRKTWDSVCRYEAEHRRALAAALPSVPPAPPPEPSPQPNPEPKFKFAKMRNGGLGVSAEELRALGDPSAPADPNDPRWRIPPDPKPK
ncbi:MAG: hypothetical protein PHI71_02090 [Acidiphilium sp.]|jgi:hypothetical protein|nr:hypothetical protein [Acidiphilium sp.]